MSIAFDNLQIIWKYLVRYDSLSPSDVIIGFGSNDISVAEHAATLYKDGIAPIIIFTGGLGKGTVGAWNETEADVFCKIATNLGVPSNRILVENRSTNTGENIRFTRDLLDRKNLKVQLATIVHQPNMGRRIYAAIKKQWPEIDIQVTAKQCSLEEYVKGLMDTGVDEYEIYSNIVGDLQRIDVFARKGFQIQQHIPCKVMRAYHTLCDLGYTKYVIS